jgi:hypothetical protein
VTEQAMPAFVRPIDMQDAESIKQELMHLDALPTVTLAIESLVLDISPRQSGGDAEHTRVFTDIE